MPNDSSEYTLRTYEPHDAAGVWDLHVEGLTGTRHIDPNWDDDVRNIPDVYLHPGCNFWVLEAADGSVAAMLAVRRIDASTAEIKRVRVRSDLRRTGLASRLISAAEAFCRRERYERIVLDTSTLQEPAQRLWERSGYKRTGEREVGEFTLVFYEKELL
jgi:ribosomal protein S18 acetylase RimI-like enzyme